MIQLRNIEVKFKERVILESVNLAVPPQSSLAIIGPSGSGKSVLLKVIAGLVWPSQGEVKVSSEKVSMLFQKNALFDSFTLLENLLIPLAETVGIHGDEATDRSMQMLKAVAWITRQNFIPMRFPEGCKNALESRAPSSSNLK